MSHSIVVAPVLVALVAATATLILRAWPSVQRSLSFGAILAYAVAVGVLAHRIVLAPDALGATAYQIGGWPAPFGITLVADALSAFMLVIVAIVAVPSLAFSIKYIDRDDQTVFYHPLFHFLVLGVSGAFLTGDLFNLFVWFEVLLMASYVFIAYYGGRQETAAAFRYVSLNLVASALMLLAIGGIYATTGTLNMADMTRRLAEPEAFGVDPVPIVGLSVLLFVVFSLKAGLVPFQFWVPEAYRAAPLPIAAMLAGATKKVGIYAIVRLNFTVFGAAELPVELPGITGGSPLAFYGAVLLVMAVGSILVGGFGAVAADSLDGLLAYSSIGQVGFIAIAIGVAASTASPDLRQLALVAALVFALHHAVAKATLFLATGAIRSATGTTRLADLGGIASRSPTIGAAFFVGSLSLVGIPPLAGFFGKFLVFDTAAQAGASVSLAALLIGSVLTIAYTSNAWITSFWGSQPPIVRSSETDRHQLIVIAALALVIVLIGVGFDPVYRFAEAAATAATDRAAYVEAVDPADPGGETVDHGVEAAGPSNEAVDHGGGTTEPTGGETP